MLSGWYAVEISAMDIEKIANWSQTGEVAIKQFITKHLEEVSEYIKKQRLSTRVVHSGILENIESEYIKVYDETNLREFKKLGFTEEELQGVKAAKAFIYNGVVYINKNSTYADLFHEMIHIKIANLALTGDITKLQNMYVKISQTEYGQAIIAEIKMNPIYSNLEDADLVEEIVAKYYEQYPEQLPYEFIGEINEEIDSYVKDVLEDTISAESLQTTAIMQKVRTFRNKK